MAVETRNGAAVVLLDFSIVEEVLFDECEWFDIGNQVVAHSTLSVTHPR